MDGINKFRAYVKKLPRAPQPAIPSREVWLSLWGAFLGIGFTALLAILWKCPMLSGAFGASAVLIYGASKEPFAQPRNVLLGHFLAACIGVTVNDFLWCHVLVYCPRCFPCIGAYGSDLFNPSPCRCDCIRGSSDGRFGRWLYVYFESGHFRRFYSGGNWRDFQ